MATALNDHSGKIAQTTEIAAIALTAVYICAGRAHSVDIDDRPSAGTGSHAGGDIEIGAVGAGCAGNVGDAGRAISGTNKTEPS